MRFLNSVNTRNKIIGLCKKHIESTFVYWCTATHSGRHGAKDLIDVIRNASLTFTRWPRWPRWPVGVMFDWFRLFQVGFLTDCTVLWQWIKVAVVWITCRLYTWLLAMQWRLHSRNTIVLYWMKRCALITSRERKREKEFNLIFVLRYL